MEAPRRERRYPLTLRRYCTIAGPSDGWGARGVARAPLGGPLTAPVA
jgi:hypothetical protein